MKNCWQENEIPYYYEGVLGGSYPVAILDRLSPLLDNCSSLIDICSGGPFHGGPFFGGGFPGGACNDGFSPFLWQLMPLLCFPFWRTGNFPCNEPRPFLPEFRRICCAEVEHKLQCIDCCLHADMRIPCHCCVRRICVEVVDVLRRCSCPVICFRVKVIFIDCRGEEREFCRFFREHCWEAERCCGIPVVEVIGEPEFELCDCRLHVKTDIKVRCF